MGKVIEFELDYTLPETGYYCTCCKNTEIDHSGKYYHAADYEALEAKLAALVDKSEKFCDRLDFVHEHEDFKAIWFLAHSHIGDYKGPRYVTEFSELKAAISAAKG